MCDADALDENAADRPHPDSDESQVGPPEYEPAAQQNEVGIAACDDEAPDIVGTARPALRLDREGQDLVPVFGHGARDIFQRFRAFQAYLQAIARARALGARRLYVSATPSENTVGFYLRRGCRLAAEIDEALFALEPEDNHLELDLA